MTANSSHYRFSQKQICELMEFSNATVDNWKRKGFQLSAGENEKLETKQGQHKSILQNTALELMLTIDLHRQNLPFEIARQAAWRFAHTGVHPASPKRLLGSNNANGPARLPGFTFDYIGPTNDNNPPILTLVIIDPETGQSGIFPALYEAGWQDVQFAFDRQGHFSATHVWDITGQIGHYRQLLGLPDEETERLQWRSDPKYSLYVGIQTPASFQR